MAAEDLRRFLLKVEHLQQMVNSLDEFPSRKKMLESCENHDEVVELARNWGFEIGRRWGEKD